MNSSHIFEVVPVRSTNYGYASSHDVLDTIRKIVEDSLFVENSHFGVSARTIVTKLREQYEGHISINTATSSSGRIFMYISGIDNPISCIRLYIKMINPPSLVSQSLRAIKMALNKTNDIQTLKLPSKFKDILIDSQN